jgi:hypothetical protein
LFDTAQTGLFIGPDSKAGSEDCAVAVEITAEVEDDGDQAVTIEPPAGEEYSWGNTTGVVTITWDAEDAGPGPVLRTLQVLSDDSEVVIPWCLEVIPVTPGEFGYELLDDEGVYGAAVGAGDVCLILQNTETVTDGEGVYTQTTEAFYLYNDPRFVRK